jgi:carbonic anhydrase
MIFAFLLAVSAAAAAPPKCEPVWTYQNQPAWGGHCPDRDLDQSPINLASAVVDRELQPIAFRYTPFPLSVWNTSRFFEVPRVKTPQAVQCEIEVDGVSYELEKFHFHVPAEHLTPHRYAGEMHLVHKNADKTKAVVVGVFFTEQKKANAALEPIVRLSRQARKCETARAGESINPETLLPAVRTYITYVGSLTTPDCDPDVTFYMLTEPIPASHAQILALGRIGPSARRPTLPLHRRVPKKSVR